MNNTLAIIIPFYNFHGRKTLNDNYYSTVSYLSKFPVKLLTVEAVLNGQTSLLDANCDYKNISHQYEVYNVTNIAWYKENLINLGINKLIKDYEYIAWFDADILFENDDWYMNIINKLKLYSTVQCFGTLERRYNDKTQSSIGAVKNMIANNKYTRTAVGGAWAATREILSQLCLYEYMIVGGGDGIWYYGCLNNKYPINISDEHTPEFKQSYTQWINYANTIINGSFSYVDQKAIFLPNGHSKNKQHVSRHKLISTFIPDKDVTIKDNGIFEINNPELCRNIEQYFINRDDDSMIAICEEKFEVATYLENNKTKILGLAGKKQSGKNTSANFIFGCELVRLGVVKWMKINKFGDLVIPILNNGEPQDYVLDTLNPDKDFIEGLTTYVWPHIKIYSWATELKNMAMKFGLTYEQVYGNNDQKNSLTKLKWENMPGIITNKLIWAKQQKHLLKVGLQYHDAGYMTAREFLQYFGSDICRRIYGKIWIDALMNTIKKEESKLAIITDVRFKNEIMTIQKNNGKVIKLTRSPFIDNHKSELDIDTYDNFDYVIDNVNMSIEEQNKAVAEKLIEWQYISPYE